MAVKIRPAVLKDAASYRRCWDIVAKERRYIIEYEAPPLSEVRAILRHNLRKENPFVVAVDGERVVGWASVCRFERAAVSHVGDFGMGLLPEYRDKGLGTKLMARVLRMCRGKFDSVFLGVLWKNKRARKLYEKMGFEPRGRIKRYVKLAYGFDDLLDMQKQLRG